jgi:hypothetical protein
MKILLALALLLATAGCTSSRFMPPTTAPVSSPDMAPTGAGKPSTGGPYTREREDQEFGQPNEPAR